MSVSVDVRNIKNKEDLRKKTQNAMVYLKAQQRLNQQYADAVRDMDYATEHNIRPVVQSRTTEDLMRDEVHQRQEAMTNVNKLLDPQQAKMFIQHFHSIDEVVAFNQVFPKFYQETHGNYKYLSSDLLWALYEKFYENFQLSLEGIEGTELKKADENTHAFVPVSRREQYQKLKAKKQKEEETKRKRDEAFKGLVDIGNKAKLQAEKEEVLSNVAKKIRGQQALKNFAKKAKEVYKPVLEKKQRAKEEEEAKRVAEEKDKAVTKMQALARGRQAKKVMDALLKSKKAVKKIETAYKEHKNKLLTPHVVNLQRRVRGNIGRRKAGEESLRLVARENEAVDQLNDNIESLEQQLELLKAEYEDAKSSGVHQATKEQRARRANIARLTNELVNVLEPQRDELLSGDARAKKYKHPSYNVPVDYVNSVVKEKLAEQEYNKLQALKNELKQAKEGLFLRKVVKGNVAEKQRIKKEEQRKKDAAQKITLAYKEALAKKKKSSVAPPKPPVPPPPPPKPLNLDERKVATKFETVKNKPFDVQVNALASLLTSTFRNSFLKNVKDYLKTYGLPPSIEDVKAGAVNKLKEEREFMNSLYGAEASGGYGVVKKAKKIKGRGLVYKPEPRYTEFGKYVLHLPSLKKNIVNLKFPSLASIPQLKQQLVSTDLRDFIRDAVDNGDINRVLYEKLNKNDKKFFNNLAKLAGIRDSLSLDRGYDSEDDEEMKRFELVKGEVVAGNDAPEVLSELKTILLKFMAEGKIPKQQAHDLLTTIAYVEFPSRK